MENDSKSVRRPFEDPGAGSIAWPQDQRGAFHKDFFEKNHAVMLLIDPEDAAIKDANPAACAYYGWSLEELRKLRIDAINTLAPEEVRAQMDLARSEKRRSFLFKHRRADGSVRDVEVYSGPMAVGGKTLLFSIVHDIADRVRAQELLAESERRLSTLMANLPGMAYRCLNDAHWTMKFVSDGCLALTGLKPAHLLDNRRASYNDMIHPEDRQMVWDRVQEAIDSRSQFNLTYRIRCADGQLKWVMETGQGVYSNAGEISALEGFITDITDRSRAEEALRQSEEKFRLTFQTSPDAINLNRLSDGMYLDINEGFTHLTGYTRDDAIGKTSLELSIWEDPKDRERLVALLTANGYAENFEARFRRKNAQVGFGLMSARVLTINQEKVILSITRDITDRRQAEVALRESEKRYRQIVESSTDGILVRSGEVIVYANPAAVRLFRAATADDLAGRNYLDLVHPDDRSESRKRIRRGMDEKWIAPPREHRVVALDGQVVHVESTGVPIQFKGEAQIFGIFRDITERKLAEKILRETEMKYRELAESLPQVIFEVDRKGALTYVNRNAYALFGYSPEEVEKGFNALEAFVPEDRERIAGDILRNIEGAKLGRQEYTALRKDGTPFPVAVHARGFRQGKSPTGVRGILIDLTEAKRAEAEKKKLELQLQQAQKMEAIGALAGGIAHDFNNILSAIIGYTELAMLDQDSRRGAGELNEALRAAKRAKELVKQILAFSRQTDEEMMPVRVALIAREAAKFLRATIPATIEIKIRIDGGSGAVLANSVELHQIIMNLCTNAAHAMGDRPGVLTIDVRDAAADRASKTRKSDYETGGYVRITVEDTGTGMSPDIKSRIFDPYFTTKEKGVGTGLGLAVVHGIVKKLGGAIEVESELGRGSAFHIYLPRVYLPENPAAQPLQAPVGGSERILFVDDEKMLAEIGEKILLRLGYRVVSRTSPLEALELFKAKPDHFDLVITDQTMPIMTGDALAKELMRIRPDLPVIVCTGYSQSLDQARAAGMGIQGFVMKPILIDEIAAAVRKVLEKKSPPAANLRP